MTSLHKRSFFFTNLLKINIFWYSSITRLKLDPTRYVLYYFLHFQRQSTSVILILTWKRSFFVTNRVKMNIFWLSSITRLKLDPTQYVQYYFLHLQRYSTSVFLILTWKKNIFVTNRVKINIFWFSSITRLKLDPTRYVQYYFLYFQRYSTSVILILTWKKSFFVTNLVKINIFWFSSITRLEQDLIRCF